MTLGHGTQGTQRLWSRYYVQVRSMIFAESEPLETDVAFVSNLHMRAVRELTFSVRVLTLCSNAAKTPSWQRGH